MTRSDVAPNNDGVVAVVIPTKNRLNLLGETLDTVRAQTYPHWVAAVVDDGSTDGSDEYVAQLSHQDPRIRLIRRTSEKGGATVCRNLGVASTRSRYVVFLDSDDLLNPRCLERRVEFMDAHPSLDYMLSRMRIFHQHADDTDFLWNGDTDEDDLDRFLRMDVPWSVTQPTWRREVMTKIGPWDESLPSFQDWDFHIRALIAGLKYERVAEIDSQYRIHNQNISAGSKSLAYLQGHERLFLRTHQSLVQAKMDTPRRRQCMAGLFFWLAEHYMVHRERESTRRVWRECRRLGLVDAARYMEGRFYFLIRLMPGSVVFRRQWLYRRWPQTMFPGAPAHLFHTPINQPADSDRASVSDAVHCPSDVT